MCSETLVCNKLHLVLAAFMTQSRWSNFSLLFALCSSSFICSLGSSPLAPFVLFFCLSLSHTHTFHKCSYGHVHARTSTTPTLSIRAAEMNALAHIQRLPGTLTDFLYLWQPQLDTFYSVLQLRPFEPAKCVWQNHTPYDKINKASPPHYAFEMSHHVGC